MEKFYTIPTLDISNDTWRQTVVDREEGLYLGHPTTALLEDGKTIFTVYPKCHGNGQIVMKKSLDGGLTWSERLPVPDSWSSSLEVPTLYRLAGKDGKKRFVMFSGLYPIRSSVSEDDGKSWSELAPIGDYGGVVALADIEPLGAPGEYLAMFHDDGRFFHPSHTHKTEVWRCGSGADARTKTVYYDAVGDGWSAPKDNWIKTASRPGDKFELIHTAYYGEDAPDRRFRLYQIITRDGGLTWSEPQMICSHKDALLCEPAIIRSPDGKKLVVLLRENGRQYNSMMISSDDNGASWSEPVELPAALTGDRHTSVYLPDGRLFISFRDMTRESPTSGDWVGWVGSFDDIVNLREGEYRVRIMDNKNGCDCAYPGVLLLPDGTVVTETYGHWESGKEPYIVSVRFKPSELDELLRKIQNA